MRLQLTNTRRVLTLAAWLAAAVLAIAREPETPETPEGETAWTPLFNGRDLSGWTPVNAPASTFTVRDGKICSTGKPISLLRTTRQYENFVLEMEWRHLEPKGNAGLFVWSQPLTAPGTPFAQAIEVQILDGRNTENYTSHGDVFAIHGASMVPATPHPNGWMRCLPSERRSRPAGEWNHYRVSCRDGVLSLAVNGKIVSGASECRPRQGYICLESEGSPAEFRNLRIRELPTTHPRADEIARTARGFRTLYSGVDLSGWKIDPRDAQRWRAEDWRLTHDGERTTGAPAPRTERAYRDFTLICDWRLTGRSVVRTRTSKDKRGNPVEVETPDAGCAGIRLRGSKLAEIAISSSPLGSGGLRGRASSTPTSLDEPFTISPRVRGDRKLGAWNRFEITLRGNTLTVDLNSTRVIEDLRIDGLPAAGPLEIISHGAPLELASILLLELDEKTDEKKERPSR